MSNLREQMKDKKRIVIKIGSSSLTHKETGDMDYIRMERLVRELSDIQNQGKEVILVTSGAVAAGKNAVNLKDIRLDSPKETLALKQACAAVGQARLMMVYQKLFAEYNLKMTFEQHVLVGSTVRSYLAWLKDQGRLDIVFDNNMLLWKENK